MATQLQTLVRRWENRGKFFEALLSKICEEMRIVLLGFTPGEKLPFQWTYEIKTSGDKVEARLWNSRVDEDPQFEQILLWLDLGTKNHWIRPVNAEYLHWIDPWSGQHRYSKGHQVSGVTASDFSARAEIVLLTFKSQIPRMWSTYMNTGRLPK